MGDSSKNRFEPDEPLDQLLHRSSRSDVDADRIERLADEWQSISRRRVRVQAGLTMMVCLTVGVGSFLAFRANPFDTPIVKPEVLPERPPELDGEFVRRDDTAPNTDGGSPSEAGDAVFDQLVCVAVERRFAQRKDDKVQPEPEPRESIDDVIALTAERLAQQQGYDDLVGRIKEEWSERELLTWMKAADDSESIDAAFHLLSRVVTSQSVPVLMRLRSMHHERCTRLIAQVAGPQVLFRLAHEENDKALGRELAAALLRHSSRQSLYLFLQLVDNRRTSATALAAAAGVENLPMDLLLQSLSARSRKVRLTAAMVLAQSKDPQVSAQLLQLLRGTQTRRAAMVALVASDNDLARRFVDQASRDVYLAASVHAAQAVVNSFRLES